MSTLTPASSVIPPIYCPRSIFSSRLNPKKKKNEKLTSGALLRFFKREGGKRRGGGGIGKAGSLALCALPIDGRDRDREYIGNLRDNNIVMATVEFSLDSSE